VKLRPHTFCGLMRVSIDVLRLRSIRITRLSIHFASMLRPLADSLGPLASKFHPLVTFCYALSDNRGKRVKGWAEL